MYSLDDTIVAISTPLGEGGIGIVRLTGPAAPDILNGLFASGPQSVAADALLPRTLRTNLASWLPGTQNA